MNKTFTEQDIKNLTGFVNLIAKEAKFTLSVQGVVDFHNLLSWVQRDLLPKMEANIFEIKSMKTKEQLEGKPKKL